MTQQRGESPKCAGTAARPASAAEIIRRYRDNNPFWRALGHEVVIVEDGFAKVRLRAEEWMRNRQGGNVNAGVLAGLIEVTGQATVMACRQPNDGLRQGTVELNVTYLAPGPEADLIAEGRVIRKGQHLVIVQVDVIGGSGKRIATGRGTYFLAPSDGPRPGGETGRERA